MDKLLSIPYCSSITDETTSIKNIFKTFIYKERFNAYLAQTLHNPCSHFFQVLQIPCLLVAPHSDTKLQNRTNPHEITV